MNEFLKWFFAFISEMLKGYADIVRGFGHGIKQIFNIKNYISIFKEHSQNYSALSWVLSILAIIIVIAIYGLIIMMIVLAIRKYVRFRHSIVSNEDLLEEIAELQRKVLKMTKEKDEIMAMKVAQMGLPAGSGALSLADGTMAAEMGEGGEEAAPAVVESGVVQTTEHRFSKLIEVDTFYKTYTPPEYDNEIDLVGIVDNFSTSPAHVCICTMSRR